MFSSGFLVAVAMTARLVRHHQQGRVDPARVPAGYGLALLGIGLFAAGGVADAAWHSLFGVEVGLAALLSPSHLLLLAGGLLMVTSPVRSAWSAPTPPSSPTLIALPVLWATTLTTAVVGFFFQHLPRS